MRLDETLEMGIIAATRSQETGVQPAPMVTVVSLSDYKNANRRFQPDICFNKRELEQLLTVYSRRVINGEWKDYAIRHDPSMAAFLIYRNNSRQPAFTVIKHQTSGGKTEFVVFHGREKLKSSDSLKDAVTVLNRKLKLVKK
jgi:hypothetical protein